MDIRWLRGTGFTQMDTGRKYRQRERINECERKASKNERDGICERREAEMWQLLVIVQSRASLP